MSDTQITADVLDQKQAIFDSEIHFKIEKTATNREITALTALGMSMMRRAETAAPLKAMERLHDRLLAELETLRGRIDGGYAALSEQDAKIEAGIQDYIPKLRPAVGERDDAAYVRELAQDSAWLHVRLGETVISAIPEEDEDGNILEQVQAASERGVRGRKGGRKAAGKTAEKTGDEAPKEASIPPLNVVEPVEQDEPASDEAQEAAFGEDVSSENDELPVEHEGPLPGDTVTASEAAAVFEDGADPQAGVEEPSGDAVSNDEDAHSGQIHSAECPPEVFTEEQRVAFEELMSDSAVASRHADAQPPVAEEKVVEGAALNDIMRSIMGTPAEGGEASVEPTADAREESHVEDVAEPEVTGAPEGDAAEDDQAGEHGAEDQGDAVEATPEAERPLTEAEDVFAKANAALSDDSPEEDAYPMYGDRDLGEDGSVIDPGPVASDEDTASDEDESDEDAGEGEAVGTFPLDAAPTGSEETFSTDDGFFDAQFSTPAPAGQEKDDAEQASGDGLTADYFPEDMTVGHGQNAEAPEAEVPDAEPDAEVKPVPVRTPQATIPPRGSVIPPRGSVIPPRGGVRPVPNRVIVNRGTPKQR